MKWKKGGKKGARISPKGSFQKVEFHFHPFSTLIAPHNTIKTKKFFFFMIASGKVEGVPAVLKLVCV
jgi:hypothetical protein